jgi:hypothetical protein
MIVEDLTIPFARPRAMAIGESREFNEICGHKKATNLVGAVLPSQRRPVSQWNRPRDRETYRDSSKAAVRAPP